jgi:hypothetical protein
MWTKWGGSNTKLYNEELYDLYFVPNIIKVIKSEENEVGKKRSTEKTAYRSEDNIKMNCKEMRWWEMD